jgi:IS1 family transposase
MVSMNRMSTARRVQVIAALVEGNSIASTTRMTGAAKGTILKLLEEAGFAAFDYQDRTIRDLRSVRVQCDEIWSFVGAKAKHVPEERKGEYGIGDVWTWVAIDADTKLAISWLVGSRNAGTANAFMQDVAARLSSRVQMTTDGHKPYLEAIEGAFGADIDYAQLIKHYGPDPEPDKRYSPAACTGTETRNITGDPNPEFVNTSYVERQNLTMRMGMRRFTRLTNAFSKKVENLEHAVSLHFLYYNFARPHASLRGRTPAMAAGLTNRQWTIADIVALIDESADPIIG